MKNQTRKKEVSKAISNSLVDLPTPKSISTMWNMGSMLGMCLAIQLVTGILLAMHYTSDLTSAFSSTMRISREISEGFNTRFMHMNTASLFFILIFTHMARGLFFSSTANKKETWASGMLILLTLMATAFLGYVLPWGQMSFWGATVITNLVSAIPILGTKVVTWLWGGFSISQPTLTRFFSLHYLLPMLISVLTIIHLMTLHSKGSSNQSGTPTSKEKVSFHPFFSSKDLTPMLLAAVILTALTSQVPMTTADPENFLEANPLATPKHIQPEWYFLSAYAILRSIPSKTGGVLAMLASILIVSTHSMSKSKNSSSKTNTPKKIMLWSVLTTLLTLTWVGANPVEPPYEMVGKMASTAYFTLILTSV